MDARRKRFGALALMWIALVLGAVLLDRPVARWVDTYQPIPAKKRKPPGVALVKMTGDFRYLSVVIVAAAVIHRARWRAAAMLLTASAISGALYGTKWVIGRHRPSHELEPFTFHYFKDGLPGIFYAQELSFPSGHACLALAVAGGLAALFPRWSWAFFTIGVIVCFQRVLEGAHYPSDVVAGAGAGLLSAKLALMLSSRWFGPGWRHSPRAIDLPEAPLSQQSFPHPDPNT